MGSSEVRKSMEDMTYVFLPAPMDGTTLSISHLVLVLTTKIIVTKTECVQYTFYIGPAEVRDSACLSMEHGVTSLIMHNTTS